VIVAGLLLARRKTTARRVAVPVVATLALAVVSYKLESMVDWRLTIFGLMTLFVVYYLQDGIVGFCATCWDAAASMRARWRAMAADPFAGVAAAAAPAATCCAWNRC
jgi:hypothetical protein